MQDCLHLVGDRHLDPMARGQSERRRGAAHAFRYFAVQVGEDVLQSAPASKLDTNCAVARLRTGTREHQIAIACEASHRLWSRTACDGKPGDLGHAARDQCGRSVRPKVKSGNNAGSERDPVLQRASKLDTDDIIVGVDAQRF